MTEPIQMTKWQAQLKNSTVKPYGGTGGEYDVRVDSFQPSDVVYFAVSDTRNPTVALYMQTGREVWTRNGKACAPEFPLLFTLRDGSLLTIDRKSDAIGDLIYTQEYL